MSRDSRITLNMSDKRKGRMRGSCKKMSKEAKTRDLLSPMLPILDFNRSSLNSTKYSSLSASLFPCKYPSVELNNSTDIRGHLSAEIVKGNVLETSESENETEIKKTKIPFISYMKPGKLFYESLNIFPHAIDSRDEGQTSHTVDMPVPERISPQKLQEEKEDSEDSMRSIVTLKSRVQFLRKMPGETNDAIPEKLIHELNTSNRRIGTSHKSGHSSLLQAQHTTSKTQHFLSTVAPESDKWEKVDTRNRHSTARVSRYAPKETNAFEDAFADSDGSMLRDQTQENDVYSATQNLESRVPRLSSPVLSSRGYKSNVADNQPNITTSPRSKFYKAYKKSSKETQDKITQDMSGYLLSDVHNVLDDRSVVLKPKTLMMKRALESSTGNPFEEILRRHSDSSRENNSNASIRNRSLPQLNTDSRINSLIEHSQENLYLHKKKRLKNWRSSDILHNRSSSIDMEPDESSSNELHRHSEKQHTKVSDAADALKSVSRESRTIMLEKSSFSRSPKEVSEISKNDVLASRTPVVVRTDANESELFEAVADDLPDAMTKSPDFSPSTRKRVSEQGVSKKALRLTRSSSRSKSTTPKVASDVSGKSIRRSPRLDSSTEHSGNLETEVETRNTPQKRTSTKNLKDVSVSKRASTSISMSIGLEEAMANDKMKDATPAPQTSPQNSPSPRNRAGNKTITRYTSARMSATQDSDESNVKQNKNTSPRQSSLTKSRGQRSSSVKGSSKDISKNNEPASETPVVRIDPNESEPLEAVTDDLPDAMTKSPGPSTSVKRVSEQGAHKKVRLTRSNSRNKPSTSKIANDVPAKSPRRSMRLNSSIEHSDDLTSEPEMETRNFLQTRRKTNASNRTIEDFFKGKHSPPKSKQATSNNPHSVPSEIFKDAKKMQQIKEQVETMKNREIAAMKMHADKINTKQSKVKASGIAVGIAVKKRKSSAALVKETNPAYLVNGKVYKAPRLLRPKQWATDRLYNFLWKRMKPKYKLSMRVRSEKFIEELSKIVSLISRRKKYNSYKDELEALMKEMARLQIINTRNDFYNFCRDFMPYEFRVKAIPILLPGNQKTIPYDPEKLHTPLLDE